MEAFHWRYHPLAARMLDIVQGGALGRVERIETNMCVPLILPGNIRYDYALGGGAMMDTGCYAVSMLRHLAGAEPEVTSAEARLSSPRVDRCMTAEVAFADGRTGRVRCSMFSWTLFDISVKVSGSLGEMRVLNPVAPQFFHRLVVRTADGKRVERFPGPSTYEHQLRAFAEGVASGAPVLTPGRDGVANMRVIDRIYEKAGLPLRGTA